MRERVDVVALLAAPDPRYWDNTDGRSKQRHYVVSAYHDTTVTDTTMQGLVGDRTRVL